MLARVVSGQLPSQWFGAILCVTLNCRDRKRRESELLRFGDGFAWGNAVGCASSSRGLAILVIEARESSNVRSACNVRNARNAPLSSRRGKAAASWWHDHL